MLAQKFYDLLSDTGAQEFLDYCDKSDIIRFSDVSGPWAKSAIDTRDESVENRYIIVDGAYPPCSWDQVILYFLDNKLADGSRWDWHGS